MIMLGQTLGEAICVCDLHCAWKCDSIATGLRGDNYSFSSYIASCFQQQSTAGQLPASYRIDHDHSLYSLSYNNMVTVYVIVGSPVVDNTDQ